VAKPKLPIRFNLSLDGKTLSSHATETAADMRAVLEAARLLHDRRVAIADYVEWEPACVDDLPELTALRLVTVTSDGTTELVSLTLGALLSSFEDGDVSVPIGVPNVYLTVDMEKFAADEYFATADGEEAGFPGWPAVIAYLKNHPELLVEPPGDEEEEGV
jgi:hypothetical protein